MYRSRTHVVITVLTVILPFAMLLAFTGVVRVERSVLFADLGVSMMRLSIAYIVAAVLAWASAAFFHRGRRSAIALPIFDVLQSFPTFAMLPLVTLAGGGASDMTVIAFLIITIIWPLFFSIISSLKLVKRDWEDAARMAGLHGTDYLTNFLWPVTIPGLITGSIIGLGEGWEALVATEIIVGNPTGLGSFFRAFANNPVMTALGIFGLLSVIFTINKLLWLPLLEWSHRTMDDR